MQNKHLPDTQNTTDIRNIVINEVGIKDILHPINFISHRARRGKELRPGYVTNIMYIEAED